MRKILGIQFRHAPSLILREQEGITREAPSDFSFTWVSILDTHLNWDSPSTLLASYDALILGGSGEYDFDGGRAADDPVRLASQTFLERLSPLFKYVFERELPTFGICYGHQIIGAWKGAQVVHDREQHKIGTHEVSLTEFAVAHPMYSELPVSLSAQYGHKDVLDRVPPGAVLLAHGGSRCRVAALQYGDHIVTTQFHPELTAQDMRTRLSSSPGYLPPGVQAEDVVAESPYASKLLTNFFKIIVQAQ